MNIMLCTVFSFIIDVYSDMIQNDIIMEKYVIYPSENILYNIDRRKLHSFRRL